MRDGVEGNDKGANHSWTELCFTCNQKFSMMEMPRCSVNETYMRCLFIVSVGSRLNISKSNKYFSLSSREWKVGPPLRPLQLDTTWKQKAKYLLMARSFSDRYTMVCRRFLEGSLVRKSRNVCRKIFTVASVCTVLFVKPFEMAAETTYMRSTSLLAPEETCIREVRKSSSHPSDSKRVFTLATTLQPILRTEGKTQKNLDFNTLLALYFLTFIALVRLCYLVVKYFQQRQKEKQIQQEKEAAAEQLSNVVDDEDAIENFRRRMNEFSVDLDEDDEDDLESEEEELRNGRRRSIDGRRISGGWRKGGGRPSSSSSAVFERPSDKNPSKEGTPSGVSPEQIEMLKRMYGGDINVDDEEDKGKDKKNTK